MVKHDPASLTRLKEMDELSRINTLYKTHPGLRTPDSFVNYLRDLFDSDRYRVLRSNWM